MIEFKNRNNYNVAVVGAAGRVGLPFSAILSEYHNVYGIDVNESLCDKINKGFIPYKENGLKELLDKNIQKSLIFTTDYSKIRGCHYIVIMIGTQNDQAGKGVDTDLMNLIEYNIAPYMTGTHKQTIILRSTLRPGTTRKIKERIENLTNRKEGVDFHLIYAPERVTEGNSIEESKTLPQIIGLFDITNYRRYDSILLDFFLFNKQEKIYMNPEEAEFTKLLTNAYRYVNFAIANQAYTIGLDYKNVDMHKVIESAGINYPRMNLGLPGPNVGGPCLYKDSAFFREYPTRTLNIFEAATDTNEFMPEFIRFKLKELNPNVESVAVLGYTFKAGSDDDRHSLSRKMVDLIESDHICCDIYDPYWGDYSNYWNDRYECDYSVYDAIIVMTPHEEFKEFYSRVMKPQLQKGCIIMDIWKLLDNLSKTGIYTI